MLKHRLSMPSGPIMRYLIYIYIIIFIILVRAGYNYKWLLMTFMLLLLCNITYRILKKRKINKIIRSLQIYDIDSMNGLDFEYFIGMLLEHQGCQVEVTKGSGDFGIDIIAKIKGHSWAIQVKRQFSRVSRRAVSDAVAGKIHYQCDSSMVIMNNYYTNGAIEHANSTGCWLVNRDDLTKWIYDFQKDHKKQKYLKNLMDG